MLPPSQAQPALSPNPNVNWLVGVMHSHPPILHPILVLSSASECYELSLPGLPPDLSHIAGIVIWPGLGWAAPCLGSCVHLFTYKDCILIGQLPKFLYQVTSQ